MLQRFPKGMIERIHRPITDGRGVFNHFPDFDHNRGFANSVFIRFPFFHNDPAPQEFEGWGIGPHGFPH